MRLPRLSLAGLMVIVLIVALDCVGVGLIWGEHWIKTDGRGRRFFDLAIERRKEVAATIVPMINVLLIVGFWGRRRPRRVGFLVVGSLAMVVAGVVVGSATRIGPDKSLLENWMEPYWLTINSKLIDLPDYVEWIPRYGYALLLLSGPATATQLVPSLLGWWFDRRYEIRRRPRSTTPAVGTTLATGV